MHKRFLVLTLMAGLTSVASARAQMSDYRFHSVFIYNFTKYIQWPANTQTGDFVIGILGGSPIVEELDKMAANKMVGAQKIVVRRFKRVTDITDCQMLFIPSADSKDFDQAMVRLKGKPTLVLTEKDGMGKRGSGINFVLLDSKWRFELNEVATQGAGLKVSRELSKLAIVL